MFALIQLQSKSMNIKHWVAALVLTTSTLSAWALPTVDTVQAEVQRGNYAQAEVMMQDVVAAKPGSARAHYIYAEILAHNKRFGEAEKESARARQIDPALSFTDPTKFKALESLLAREQIAVRPRAANSVTVPMAATTIASARPAAVPETGGGMPPWLWALGLGGIAALVWSLVSRRQQAASAGMGLANMPAVQPQATGYGPGNAPGYGAAAAPGYAPGYGQAAPRGAGLMGVGLAAAGGVAAGMLAEKLMHGGSGSASNTGLAQGSGLASPGMFDDAQASNPAARELEQRPIDFGNGDGWGGDNTDADGGSDQGGDGW
jgi:hypothetical protein